MSCVSILVHQGMIYNYFVFSNALEAFKKEESREIFSRGPTTTESTLSRRYRQKNSLENVQISKNSQATVQNGDIVTAHRKRRNCSCKKGKKLMVDNIYFFL